MNRLWTTRRAAASAGLAVFLLASAGSAEPSNASAARPPLASALTGEAKAAYERARQLYALGDAAGAFTSFKRAYQITGDARLLWNMAASAKSQRRYARAHALVTSYLRDEGRMLSAESRAAAEQTQHALRALFSEVELRGAPVGARVQVDGEDVDRPTLGKLGLDVGPHTLRVEHDEFAPFESHIEVTGPGDLALEVAMSPKANARLRVSAAAGDTIRVDGVRPSLGQWEGAVAPGTHTVSVTAPGKKPYSSALDLTPQSTRTLQVALEPERTSAWWPWITAGAALSVGAVVGGYFLLRPRTEPGVQPEGGFGTAVVRAGATSAR